LRNFLYLLAALADLTHRVIYLTNLV